MQQRLTKEQKEEIAKLYRAGVAARDIGKQFGVHSNSVNRILRKMGIEPTKLVRVNEQQAAYIVDLYNNGISSEEIGKLLNISGVSVRRILKRQNINIRPNSRNSKQDEKYLNQQIKQISDRHNLINRPENYGTTYIPSFNNIILTKYNLPSMSKEDKIAATEFLFNFYRKNGFPFPVLTDNEILRDFTLLEQIECNSPLIENNILTLYKDAGIDIFKHFSPHFWEIKNGYHNRASVIEAFNDDRLLKKAIFNRLDGNYNMTGNMLRQGLVNSKVAYKASIFFPHIAKFLYSKYTKENDIIYDYSMGFGQRLLGALSLPYQLKYVAADVDQRSIDAAKNIYNVISKYKPMLRKEIDLHCIGAEHFCDENYRGKIKFAFSSPPYWNLEKYSNDVNQAGNQGYADFLMWWKKVVQNIDTLLSSDGRFVINIANKVDIFNIKDDMCNIIKQYGYEVETEYNLQLTRNTHFNNTNGEHKYEPIIIFRRNV